MEDYVSDEQQMSRRRMMYERSSRGLGGGLGMRGAAGE